MRFTKKKKKKKVKEKDIYYCPTCHRSLSDTPASRWQHRQRNMECKRAYQIAKLTANKMK